MTDLFFSQQTLQKITTKIHEQQNRSGLYVVATPIGNIFDITIRAIHILRNSKYVFAEDTRQSRKLLDYYDINAKLIPCHEYNEIDKSVTSLIDHEHIFSLISDAGTPAISDPGYRIVNWCIDNNINVYPVPGASSVVSGLCVSGLATDSFTFYGFPPTKLIARRKFLDERKNNLSTLIFFESPKRIVETLSDMLEIFGDRRCCLCREISKLFEEYKRGKISDMINTISDRDILGECVIIVSGASAEQIDTSVIHDELSKIMRHDSLKNAVSLIQKKYNLSKKTVYQMALDIKGN